MAAKVTNSDWAEALSPVGESGVGVGPDVVGDTMSGEGMIDDGPLTPVGPIVGKAVGSALALAGAVVGPVGFIDGLVDGEALGMRVTGMSATWRAVIKPRVSTT
jgi:hypothetical protein